MTGGWAATNTLREAFAIAWPEGDHAEPNVFTEALAALALVEAALDAAEAVGSGGQGIAMEFPYLSEGLDALASALRAVREGKYGRRGVTERNRTAVCAPSDDGVYERPSACPREGQIAPFDAGWYAHEVGLDRETVRVLAADPAWALLGWDARQLVVSRARGAVS